MRELPHDLLLRCRRADAAAFRALVVCYQDRVWALCAALAGNDADDVAQETFVRVHGAIARFDPMGPATLGGFILTIARRLCHDRARSARVRTEVGGVAAAVLDGIASSDGPDGDLCAAQERARVQGAVASLPEEQRAVVVLREWDGLTYEQIAEIEKVPVGTVRSRLARARDTLRRTLIGAAKEDHVA